ncbi:MAG: DNA polymerase [Blautia sp.]|nr:DNA polymerase [Blautia sp.]
MINTISIDIETYSDADLNKCGVYRYTESEAFDILLFAYAVNGGSVSVVDLASGGSIPSDVIQALLDPHTLKWAFNAAFERICLSAWLHRNYPKLIENTYLDSASWRCSMIWSAYMGLPLSLAGAGKVLGLEEQKMTEGKELIRYFCSPCKPTKTNGGRTRNLPDHDPDKWKLFKAYNKRDVEVEMSIQEKLKNFPVPEFIWEEYHLDQEINDRGIMLDMRLVEEAVHFDSKSKDNLTEKLQLLTGLDNPNSVVQMKQWLSDCDIKTESLGKKGVAALIKEVPEEYKEVLQLRQQLAKSSVKKYQAMQNTVCRDGRAHGMFQFYGANRSGRWAGRHIQLQNLPQNHLPDLSAARALVRSGDYETTELLYEDVPDTLSQLIRTAFIPKPGYKFIVSDFSAIEARVLSHLAGENWRTEVFANNGDIYCASASAMFGVPVEKHGQNSHLRQKGKIAELALGYGGSVGALISMGALDMGLQEEELKPLVDAWRSSNPNIVRFWWDVDRAVKTAVRERTRTAVKGIIFRYQSGMLFITLPSGRTLSYVKPRIGENHFGGENVTYEGIGSTKKWERLESYGPKFVENIVQAISRDILMYAIRSLSHCSIVGHVHDELIIECSPETSLEIICEEMGKTPNWLPELLLRADGYETEFYKKD